MKIGDLVRFNDNPRAYHLSKRLFLDAKGIHKVVGISGERIKLEGYDGWFDRYKFTPHATKELKTKEVKNELIFNWTSLAGVTETYIGDFRLVSFNNHANFYGNIQFRGLPMYHSVAYDNLLDCQIAAEKEFVTMLEKTIKALPREK